MMSARRREPNIGLTAGVTLVAVAVAVAALFGLDPRTGSTETTVLRAVLLEDPHDAEPTEALVVANRRSGGISVFGLRFGHATYRMSVRIFAPPGCSELVDSGDPWPSAFEECSSPVPITGTISGEGIAATGESIIAVDVEVSEACYESVARGDSWPSPSPACATPE